MGGIEVDRFAASITGLSFSKTLYGIIQAWSDPSTGRGGISTPVT